MTTPAVHAVRKAFPHAEIRILAKPWVIPVFENSPDIDVVLVYETQGSRHRGIAGIHRLARELRQHHFDAALLLQNAFEAAFITWVAGIPARIGFDTDARRLLLTHPVRCTPRLKRVHQTRYYLEILRGIGKPAREHALHLSLSDANRERAETILRSQDVGPGDRLVGINPGASFGPAKQWFPDRFARLADLIQERCQARVLIFGGPGDRVLGETISQGMHGSPIDLSGRTTLSEAMALIDACDLFVTNDSGLMHVAAALDRPLIAIFGSTNPVTTGPFSSRSRVIRTPIPCSPCLKPVCPYGHMDCMERIDVDAVFKAAEEML